MKCPKCNGKNIVKIGEFYQCQTGYDPETFNRLNGCGFIGKEIDFSEQSTLK